MKKIIIVLAVVISFPLLAQPSGDLFKQLTEKYADQNGFSASRLTNDMFDLYIKKKNVNESSELADALRSLDNILVVSQSKMLVDEYYRQLRMEESDKKEMEDVHKAALENIHADMLAYYKKGDYTLFKTEKRMGEDVKVYLKKEGDRIASLVLLTNSSASTNLVELNGDIDLATVASLSKIINLRGLENLYKIDNSSSYVGQFPSAGYFEMSEERIAEMEARAHEMAERHAELSEEQRAKIEQQAQLQAQKQMEMAEKYREMAEKYGRQPIFLSAPGDTNTVYYINGKKIKPENIKKRLQDEEIKQIVKSYDEEEGGTVIKITTK